MAAADSAAAGAGAASAAASLAGSSLATEPSSDAHPRAPLGRVGSRTTLEERRALLSFGGPREVLARIVEGDPLELRARIADRVRERCLLLDADRAHLRALALCARHAPRYRGRPGLGEWLAGLVDRALDELVSEEAERLECPPPARPTAEGAFLQLARPLGLAPEELRRACARFNRQPREVRAAFCELVLERRPLDELAREAQSGSPQGGATELARRARRALLALLGPQVGAPSDDAAGAAPAATRNTSGGDPRGIGTAGPAGDERGETAL